jgi:NAD-dependent DNA ligase
MLPWPGGEGVISMLLNDQQMNDLTTYISKNGIDHLGLEEREKLILLFRYKENYSFQQIADHFSLTVSRIRQIEAKALRRMLHAKRRYLWDTKHQRKLSNHEFVTVLGFSVRTSNRLRRAGIETIEQLSEKTYEELIDLKGLGPKGLREIKNFLVR